MEEEIVVTDRDVPPEVLEAVRQGRKIVAIKILREATGLGLANAKVIVDRLAAEQARGEPAGALAAGESQARRLLLPMALLIALLGAGRYFFA